MGAPAIVAVMRRRENEVIDDFRAAQATSREKAQSYMAVGLGHSLALKRLRERAVIREATPGTYYLDEEVWTAVRKTRRRIGSIMILVLALFLLGTLLGIMK